MNQFIMILLISVLILVHEIGHFIAARLCGVRVTRFGFGMPIGPSWKLFKWKRTTFYLHAFLFGGYVSFPDDSIENADEKNEDEDLPSDSPELYENKTIGQKLFIVSAGVIMNVLFAILLVIFCAAFYHKLPSSTQSLYIDSLADKVTSNISQYNIQNKDKIVSVNNIEIKSIYQLKFFTKNSKQFDDYAQSDLVEKNLAELKTLNPDIGETIKAGAIILLPETKSENPLSVRPNVTKGLEKYKKDGVKLSKEQIELRNKVYNKRVYTTESDVLLNDLAYALSDTYKPLTMKLMRNNHEVVLDDIKVYEEGDLGIKIYIPDLYTETKTFKDIIFKSCEYIYSTTAMMLFGLWQLISGKISASDMHGVIAIVKVGGDIIASRGMLNGILLTAMISINLAIMNFLPIPALDGGHVLFLTIEKLTGKKPTKELGEKINNVFFVLLIILMIAICYNDIFALVTKKL